MKLPRDVGVGKSPSPAIWRLQSGRGSKFPKKGSAAPGRFAMSMSEVKGVVLRKCQGFHMSLRSREKVARRQIDRTQSIYSTNEYSLGLIASDQCQCTDRKSEV